MILFLITLFASFSIRPPDTKVPLHARVICAEGRLNPDGTLMNSGWRVAVTKPNEQSRFWHWSVWMQETNRQPNGTYALVPLKKDSLDFETTPELTNEHGILVGGGFGLIQTGNVYRVVGALNEPENTFLRWTSKLPPRLRKLIPTKQPRFATSEWYEITIPPLGTNLPTSAANQ